MSNLILCHSLLNGNHRTGIATLRTHVNDDTWGEWVDSYIVDPKRIIAVCRNSLRLK